MTAERPGTSTRPSNSGQEGFALLEGLVAIALLAGTLVAIFALVGNILDAASRVGRSNASAQITMNAIEAMAAVNPMMQGSGKIDLGPYAVTWTSAAMTPIIDRAGNLYQICLYNMEVRVEDQPGSVLANFMLRQIGYRRVRDPGPTLGDQGLRSGDPTRSQ
ncbi:MAG: type II secretion system protein [Stellaceae bacterium]